MVIAATLLASGLLAACGSEDGDVGTDETTGPEGDAAAALQEAFDAGAAIDSGRIKLTIDVGVQQKGDTGGVLNLGMNGPFSRTSDGSLSYSLEATAIKSNVDPAVGEKSGPYKGELVSTGDAGFLIYDQYPILAGNYELDSPLHELLQTLIGAVPQTPSLLSNVEFDDGEGAQLGVGLGTPVTQINADVDVDALADAINSLVADTGELGFGVDPSSELPSGTVDALADTIDSASVVFNVSDEDDLVRRTIISAELSGVDVESVRIVVGADVTPSDEASTVTAPGDTEPLSNLLRKLQRVFAAVG